MPSYSLEIEDNFSLFFGEGFFENRRYRYVLTNDTTGKKFLGPWVKSYDKAQEMGEEKRQRLENR